ncbi:hypothetical protein QR680_009168 [Steinernema hermaphroditum]|uniref:Uncharacterized protein n=1 Tax=Steinernema hermaphroditum TaxID=289476 RepID=A0AA39IJA2_9BILA|nr:hypothetical protein QR680_009168 [Steinernema hermaphroditum]
MNIEIETKKVASRQTYLVTSQALESDPRTASVAHQQALRVVSANARSEEEAHNVRLNFPSKRTARRTYQNHARKAYPKADSGKIPECFKTVLSPAVGHLEQTENQWLLHSEEDYSVHIFCDAHALRNLWRSDCIVLDGNYKYAPPSYQQVYSFVSVFNVNVQTTLKVSIGVSMRFSAHNIRQLTYFSITSVYSPWKIPPKGTSFKKDTDL